MSFQRPEAPRIRTPHGRSPLGRRNRREGGQVLTVGYRRYVEAVLAPGQRTGIDAALISAYGDLVRRLATAVRRRVPQAA
jgi:hypothetical protein